VTLANAIVGGILPDCSFQPSKTKLVDWLARCRRCCLGLLLSGLCGFVSHLRFLLSSEEDLGPAPEAEEQVSGTRETTPE
jgi:hypothetical protein